MTPRNGRTGDKKRMQNNGNSDVMGGTSPCGVWTGRNE